MAIPGPPYRHSYGNSFHMVAAGPDGLKTQTLRVTASISAPRSLLGDNPSFRHRAARPALRHPLGREKATDRLVSVVPATGDWNP